MKETKNLLTTKTAMLQYGAILGAWGTYLSAPSPALLGAALAATAQGVANILMRRFTDGKATFSGQ